MKSTYTAEKIAHLIQDKINRLGISDIDASSEGVFYQAVALVVGDILYEKRKKFWASNLSAGKKQVYYLSMEFLLGRSLKNSLYNLGMNEIVEAALTTFDIRLENLYNWEPDAGLGNGGLGRLAACYLDGLAHENYLATGYCILYEFGIFKQHIIDGWQSELPDQWLPGGEVWLTPKTGYEVEIRFGGQVVESWEKGYHVMEHKNYTTVMAIPYDINIPGYHSPGTSMLRVWKAKNMSGMDMDSFNRGDYSSAFHQTSVGEAISKVLYPNDNHHEGKMLRLRQQYFLCAASVADIFRRHLSVYGTLANFAQKNAIHINDTHPTLAIPEMMRFLLDDCGFAWDAAWEIVHKVFAYTNHTVMREAMECWDEGMMRALLPRIYSIICEINRRFCLSLFEEKLVSQDTITQMAIVAHNQVRMAHLAVVGSHSVNGVSGLHSQILKDDVFHDFYTLTPEKFTNVTNGIASRRWLIQSNPSLTSLISDAIGKDFDKDLSSLSALNRFSKDKSFLDQLAASKRQNKVRFSKYVERKNGISLDPDSIFDVQVKRLHEYKRQQLNALEIISTYNYLLENPKASVTPRTFIFGAKAAPGYYMAKQIIKLICTLSKIIENDPVIREKMRVVFLEEYNVTLSELLMPASDISEQISLAGTEASGTGNMKLMLNGAVTLGTLDGANVEIRQQVGDKNIIIFGMTAQEVDAKRKSGYYPSKYYDSSPMIRQSVDTLLRGLGSESFPDIYSMLTQSDYYMTLADFEAYKIARNRAVSIYEDKYAWLEMSLRNIAQSGFFSADRAVSEYANTIWGLQQ